MRTECEIVRGGFRIRAALKDVAPNLGRMALVSFLLKLGVPCHELQANSICLRAENETGPDFVCPIDNN
jgi:hypothetical protein